MILGLNTNHDHNGKVFHIQTEDSGLDNPVIVTHCFIGGTIIASRRTDYTDARGRDDLEEHIRGIARAQHRAMVKALLTGEFDKAAHLSGRGATAGDIPLARDKGRLGQRPRPLLTPTDDRPAPPPAPAADESIEEIDSAEMRLVDDGPIIDPDAAAPIEYTTPLLTPEPLDPVLLAWLLEDDQVN